VLLFGCGDDSNPGNPADAANHLDAPATDASNVDAQGDASNLDAPVDAPAIDAAVDASPDAALAPVTIFTIVLSLHDYNEIVGSTNAPYLNSLIAANGLATNYHDVGTGPGLPNRLEMVSGNQQYNSFGVLDSDPTIFPFPVNSENLGSQLEAASIPWRAYAEEMGTACRLSINGNYAPKRVPFLYFTNIQNGAANLCAARVVDSSNLAADLAQGTNRYYWISPSLNHDGTNPSTDPVASLQAADTWLSTNVPPILASAAYQANGVLFITVDHAQGRNGDSTSQVPMVIVSRRIVSPGFQSAIAYNHASYLATVEMLLGLPRLGDAATATPMLEFLR
jgi:hypothetical protein